MKDGAEDKFAENLATEKASVVRLIIQRPSDGAVLLRRYDSGPEDDGAFGSLDLVSYWSFKGLSGFRILDGETSTANAIIRSADRKLGIKIRDLSVVKVVIDSMVTPNLINRVYVHTAAWEGDLGWEYDPDHPDHFARSHNDYQGLHAWCLPKFLSTYVHHAEVLAALDKAEEQIMTHLPLKEKVAVR